MRLASLDFSPDFELPSRVVPAEVLLPLDIERELDLSVVMATTSIIVLSLETVALSLEPVNLSLEPVTLSLSLELTVLCTELLSLSEGFQLASLEDTKLVVDLGLVLLLRPDELAVSLLDLDLELP